MDTACKSTLTVEQACFILSGRYNIIFTQNKIDIKIILYDQFLLIRPGPLRVKFSIEHLCFSWPIPVCTLDVRKFC